MKVEPNDTHDASFTWSEDRMDTLKISYETHEDPSAKHEEPDDKHEASDDKVQPVIEAAQASIARHEEAIT